MLKSDFLLFSFVIMVIEKIGEELSKVISSYSIKEDSLLYNGKEFAIDSGNFAAIETVGALDSVDSNSAKEVCFIDGGQAEVLMGGSFCVSFIRVAAAGFLNGKKTDIRRHEFYFLTYAQDRGGEIFYVSKVFANDDFELLIREEDLIVSSRDGNLQSGLQRASISKVTNMARRFAELELARRIGIELSDSGYVVLDGILQASFTGEEKILDGLGDNVFGLAKTSQLFTREGNNPCVLLNSLVPKELATWSYRIIDMACFVKLHEKSRHIFRFEGKKNIGVWDEVLPLLVGLSTDPIFLGYPYGLVFVDQIARVSEQERRSLKIKFLFLTKGNSDLANYLATNDAHSILDSIG